MECVEILCRESGEKGVLREAGERIMWVSLGQWSSVPELAPKETSGNFWLHFWLLRFGWEVLRHLVHRGQGVMPNILRYTEQPAQQRITWSKMSVVSAVEKTLL